MWLAIALMMIVFAVTRWPGLMPPNFSAAYALAFCAGVYFPGRLRWVLPLGVMLLMDAVLNVFYYGVSPANPYVLVQLGAFGLLIWLGQAFTSKASWLSLTGGGMLGAVLFYLVTNTASWLYDPAYPKTLAGWIQALTAGRPGLPPTWEFFRNTLLSGGLFTGLFCGVMKLSEAAEESEEEAGDEQPENEPVPEEA